MRRREVKAISLRTRARFARGGAAHQRVSFLEKTRRPKAERGMIGTCLISRRVYTPTPTLPPQYKQMTFHPVFHFLWESALGSQREPLSELGCSVGGPLDTWLSRRAIVGHTLQNGPLIGLGRRKCPRGYKQDSWEAGV